MFFDNPSAVRSLVPQSLIDTVDQVSKCVANLCSTESIVDRTVAPNALVTSSHARQSSVFLVLASSSSNLLCIKKLCSRTRHEA
ncbi:hypothetical protein CEXT_111151 [Caerostris extrusa]|uniref:Uncharacterized protein n=1 Tax=Caerostris extrusa TaxID=172846 RepID=A0AAV4MWR6_CAEEX|nr:hypothetical protein CEXT_111151 [Caerostris extrusa]